MVISCCRDVGRLAPRAARRPDARMPGAGVPSRGPACVDCGRFRLRFAFLRRSTLGEQAVPGFFCLSGFLIAGSRMRLDLGRFLWHRALRIFPAYWTCLIVVAFRWHRCPRELVVSGRRAGPWTSCGTTPGCFSCSSPSPAPLVVMSGMHPCGPCRRTHGLPHRRTPPERREPTAGHWHDDRPRPCPQRGQRVGSGVGGREWPRPARSSPAEQQLRRRHAVLLRGPPSSESGELGGGSLPRDRGGSGHRVEKMVGPCPWPISCVGRICPTSALVPSHRSLLRLYIYAFPVQVLLEWSLPDLTLAAHTFAAMMLTLPLAWLSWRVVERPALRFKSVWGGSRPDSRSGPCTPTSGHTPARSGAAATGTPG